MGSPQVSTIDKACFPYFTGSEPPVSPLLRLFWVRFAPDQVMLTQGLQVNQKVFQQAGRIKSMFRDFLEFLRQRLCFLPPLPGKRVVFIYTIPYA